jgi:adenylate kinase family enzyme
VTYDLVILGPPGSGKTTLASYLSGRLGVPCVTPELILPPEGFIADGAPSTVAAAFALDNMLRSHRRQPDVLLLEVPYHRAACRLGGRLHCERGHVYHRRHAEPAVTRRCDHDGGELVRSPHDRARAVWRRVAAYHRTIGPVLRFYAARHVLHRIEATGSVAEVRAATLRALQLPVESSQPPRAARQVRAMEALASAFGYFASGDES